MKIFLKTYTAIVGMVLTMASVCCSCETNEPSNSDGNKSVKVIFNMEKPTYSSGTRAEGVWQGEQALTRSEGEDSWAEGSLVILRFQNASGAVTHGKALYKEGKWTVSYYGPLTEGATNTLKATYVENPEKTENSKVVFNEGTAVYSDVAGNYSFDGTTLTLTATLKPAFGRVRFKGVPNETITVTGIKTFTEYNTLTDSYTEISSPIELTVGGDGYTRYIYGAFASATAPNLSIEGEGSWYMRDVPTTIYLGGQSGFIELPTADNCNGWFYNEIQTVTVGDVPIRMMKVIGETGGVYYLSQTEVTEEQYYAVMSGNVVQKQLPTIHVYNDWVNYLQKISQLSGKKFRCPTVSEWQWGAKGGIYTRNYVFPGGDDAGTVGWYSDNSGKVLHLVKQKKPNEIGLYDMGGNSFEIAMDGSSFCTIGGGHSYNNTYMSLDYGPAYRFDISTYGSDTSKMFAMRLLMEQ